jgi:hypothetical protein
MTQSAARRARRIAARDARHEPAEFATLMVSLHDANGTLPGATVKIDHEDWDGLIEQLKAARRVGGTDLFTVLRRGQHHAMLTDLARRTVFPEGLAPPDLKN